MTCNSIRELILTADPAELRGEGVGQLAAHLRTCDDCRRIAAHLGADLRLLSTAIIARGVVTPPRRRYSRLALVASLPIAAALIAMVLLRDRREPPAAGRQQSATISVDVARGQQATVIKTKDPTVTVVWISPGGTE